MNALKSSLLISCLISFCLFNISHADDWPMWRHDAGRTAVTSESLPEEFKLLWSLQLPPLKPAYRTERLQFDAGYEPIVSGNLVLLASSYHDSVTAYDLNSGNVAWNFFTNGPVRLAPVVWKESVLFGSDDGCFYSVELKTGQLKWKKKAVPNDRKIFGNGRLISVWPVRGGAVVKDGIVYFTAGVWPFEGIFVYALEAETGKVVWLNDQLGTIYGDHPHRTVAVGGLAPQGYLVINGDELIIPCSAAYPARLDLNTGELIEFKLPTTPRYPGGWFASLDPKTAKAVRRGEIIFDRDVNVQRHEDKVQHGEGLPDIRRKITAGSSDILFDEEINELKGFNREIHSLVVANQKVVVTGKDGSILCYGHDHSAVLKPEKVQSPKTDYDPQLKRADQKQQAMVRKMLSQVKTDHGYAFVIGIQTGSIIRELLHKTKFHVVVLDSDKRRVDEFRKLLALIGAFQPNGSVLYRVGTPGQEADTAKGEVPRCSVIHLEDGEFGLPPYAAELITTENPEQLQEIISDRKGSASELLNSLRPYGGVLCLPDILQLQEWQAVLNELPESFGKYETSVSVDPKQKTDSVLVIRRKEGLPGAKNYVQSWNQNRDERVRFPAGLLWFDDTVGNFKRSPQPRIVDGVMESRGKDWTIENPKRDAKHDYPLLPAVYTDIYSGRVMEVSEITSTKKELPEVPQKEIEDSQYRPPYQKNHWNPAKPEQGQRTNPLTGKEEKRIFPKNYGCDGGVDYGFLFTMRSGTPAYYDKTLESGTMYISGPRSGCTNSVIPAGGLLNVPYFFEGCTCSYPLPASLSLAPMPETHEQWVVWGESKPEEIIRAGINFGAPGDRMTRSGTLWLNYPNRGEPSPELELMVEPSDAKPVYRHSLWMNEGEGWPWVQASALEGASLIELNKIKPGKYTIRLFFSESEETEKRIQNISLQGNIVLENFEILADAENEMTGVVKEFTGIQVDGNLRIELNAVRGTTRINGIELIRE